jgi:hypothetical protein
MIKYLEMMLEVFQLVFSVLQLLEGYYWLFQKRAIVSLSLHNVGLLHSSYKMCNEEW